MVLKSIINEPPNSIKLIQGPPGTGKTHTIVGIVQMIIQSGAAKRILICTPSNKAIDEIIDRLS